MSWANTPRLTTRRSISTCEGTGKSIHERKKRTGSELFIVDNSDEDWKVHGYLQEWCEIARAFDIATGYFEIGSLLSLDTFWQKLEEIRILMGDEVSMRTKQAFERGLSQTTEVLEDSIEVEKEQNDFLVGVPAIVEALHTRKIEARVFREKKFHACSAPCAPANASGSTTASPKRLLTTHSPPPVTTGHTC